MHQFAMREGDSFPVDMHMHDDTMKDDQTMSASTAGSPNPRGCALPQNTDDELVQYLPMQMKMIRAEAVERFNEEPKRARAYLVEQRAIKGTPADMAKFLYCEPMLSKRRVGEYIGSIDAYNQEVCEALFAMYQLHGLSLDEGIRHMAKRVRLPGEAQQIDRIVEKFAHSLAAQNPMGLRADTLYILAFSLIMLNTDLHNPSISKKRKMSKTDFLRNNRGIDGGVDVPEALLNDMYDRIKKKPIVMDEADMFERSDEIFVAPVKAGWMTKRTNSVFPMYQRRWFLLKNACLYYFREPGERDPRAIIPLDDTEIIRGPMPEMNLSDCDILILGASNPELKTGKLSRKGMHARNDLSRLKGMNMSSLFQCIESGEGDSPLRMGKGRPVQVMQLATRSRGLRLRAASPDDCKQWYAHLKNESEPLQELYVQEMEAKEKGRIGVCVGPTTTPSASCKTPCTPASPRMTASTTGAADSGILGADIRIEQPVDEGEDATAEEGDSDNTSLRVSGHAHLSEEDPGAVATRSGRLELDLPSPHYVLPVNSEDSASMSSGKKPIHDNGTWVRGARPEASLRHFRNLHRDSDDLMTRVEGRSKEQPSWARSSPKTVPTSASPRSHAQSSGGGAGRFIGGTRQRRSTMDSASEASPLTTPIWQRKANTVGASVEKKAQGAGYMKIHDLFSVTDCGESFGVDALRRSRMYLHDMPSAVATAEKHNQEYLMDRDNLAARATRLQRLGLQRLGVLMTKQAVGQDAQDAEDACYHGTSGGKTHESGVASPYPYALSSSLYSATDTTALILHSWVWVNTGKDGESVGSVWAKKYAALFVGLTVNDGEPILCIYTTKGAFETMRATGTQTQCKYIYSADIVDVRMVDVDIRLPDREGVAAKWTNEKEDAKAQKKEAANEEAAARTENCLGRQAASACDEGKDSPPFIELASERHEKDIDITDVCDRDGGDDDVDDDDDDDDDDEEDEEGGCNCEGAHERGASSGASSVASSGAAQAIPSPATEPPEPSAATAALPAGISSPSSIGPRTGTGLHNHSCTHSQTYTSAVEIHVHVGDESIRYYFAQESSTVLSWLEELRATKFTIHGERTI